MVDQTATPAHPLEPLIDDAFERRAANLEHQSSGLVWALDNWIYTTVNAVRIRWTPQGVLAEPTAPAPSEYR